MNRSPISDKLRSPWALKKLNKHARKNKELSKRLKVEAEVLRQLNHPNIVGFRAFIDKPNENVLAMEQCSTSLGDLIETRNEDNVGPFPAKTIIKVLADVSNALNYLHNEAHILHCDVKSYNILVKDEFSICKLCDFGVCLPLNDEGYVDFKKTGDDVEFEGTLAWAAPELLEYPEIISMYADVYALGLVIYEMLALLPPVDDATVDSMLDESVIEIKERGRPALPDDLQLNDDYNIILELYYICTLKDMTKRPTAMDLTVLTSDL